MKTLLTIALIVTASGASATEYCLVKRAGGEPAKCFKTSGQCDSKADRMNGWRCEKR
ncbi:hypothetical protein CLV78_102553 [Aliiruegeria haliotis]|uniref:Uncharacterized protein n=1 Tax=Aliiruegeria haliotis TaxID=1280846 RepID=A0A2T0RW03_9RHOB|nr:hypothetical protein [Aliiruegeria haliotis]PRY25375.1 hypothetical protein CLV78_102553 [Aliiruegeria haliotis]